MFEKELKCFVQKGLGQTTLKAENELKRLLLEHGPYIVALICIAALLPNLIDVLGKIAAICFWRNRKSMEGLSVRSIPITCFVKVSFAAVLCLGQYIPLALLD